MEEDNRTDNRSNKRYKELASSGCVSMGTYGIHSEITFQRAKGFLNTVPL